MLTQLQTQIVKFDNQMPLVDSNATQANPGNQNQRIERIRQSWSPAERARRALIGLAQQRKLFYLLAGQ